MSFPGGSIGREASSVFGRRDRAKATEPTIIPKSPAATPAMPRVSAVPAATTTYENSQFGISECSWPAPGRSTRNSIADSSRRV